MKVSTSWLHQYIEVTTPEETLAEALTMAGLEVEGITDRFAFLDTVRVGRIVAAAPHPNADRLTCCTVDIGTDPLQVVCGAPNARIGMLTACALPGTVLPDGTELSAGNIRGERSEGMLCSEGELSLGPDYSGIMDLDDNMTVGMPLNRALSLRDPVFEIDLTPNRPDCLSILGIAREVAAIQGNTVVYPDEPMPAAEGNIAEQTSVTIDAPELCPRYAARLVRDVVIGPSPFWLQDRLLSIGLKPINNVVDITNFVMMETGQPLHAFDFDHLEEHRIVVRAANAKESFTTLDNKPRTLDAGMLLICDGKKPAALAGVMGGLNSEIEADTTSVLIEGAYFNPVSIRKTAKSLGLGTDASHRFERGVDPLGTVTAINRAAQLMCRLADGTLVDGVVDANPIPAETPVIELDVTATNRRLGTRLSADEMTDHLERIEFAVERADSNRLLVTPPSYRVDITRFEDLTEEVARLYGYNQIDTTYPAMPANRRLEESTGMLRARIRQQFVGFGFSECINYSFVAAASADHLRLADDDRRRQLLPILNPISEDQAVMRTSLIPGLLDTARRNDALQTPDVMLFEVGKVFYQSGTIDNQPEEEEMLAVLWSGRRRRASWQSAAEACDFYDIKGVAESLLAGLGIRNAVFSALADNSCRYTVPGASARIEAQGQVLGIVGEVHPDVRSAYGVKQRAFILEMDIRRLDAVRQTAVAYKPVTRFPAADRDITLIIESAVEAMGVVVAAEAMDEPLLERVDLFDVYTGDPIPAGKKSVSIRMTYRSADTTLEDENVNRMHQQISDRLIAQFKATLPA